MLDYCGNSALNQSAGHAVEVELGDVLQSKVGLLKWAILCTG